MFFELPTSLKSLKKILSLLIVVALCCCVMDASAQKRKTTKKKTAKKEKTVSKPAPQQKTQPAEETIYVSPYFEGDLLYRNEEFHSKAIRMMSGGMTYNGDRSVLLTMCEEGIRISDLDKHFHTVIIPEENIGYAYSELLDYGYALTLDQIKQLYNSLDPDYQQFPDDPKFIKSGNFSTKPDNVEYAGDNCAVITGKVTVGDTNESETEMWVYNCQVPEAYRYFTYGYNPNGIVKRMIINHRMALPLIGNAKSMVASELVAVEERPVAVEDLLPPESMTMRPAKDIGKLYGYYKEVNKKLKKLKLQQKTKKAKEVKRSIQAKWDFADEWLDVQLQSQTAKDLEESLASSLTSILDSFSSLGEEKNNDNNSERKQEIPDDSNGKGNNQQKEMVYIPDLIREIQIGVAPFKANVEDYDKARAYNGTHGRKKRIRIGSSYVYVTEIEGMRKPVLDKIGYKTANSMVADSRRIIDLVIQYGKNNNTDSIPRERYNKIRKAVYDNSLAQLKMATKAAKDRRLRNSREIYNHYANMLMREYYSHYERDFRWIERVQRNMKKLRAECECPKSPWEDWDGVTDPTK